ncbi:MAG: ribonuclease protein subunit [Methanothermococcus sp.]|jgi:ribonuclease P protein subunit POP4|uniref:ribonuclease P protein component 1 n=1 Tax=Methanothermococcus TaxID=155862 RepID=UPI000370F9E6|nr:MULTISPECIES: ribonuclease P protein component 1 [Methanothermococcus]MDK2789781.1 ribonuclease protein subunit [Methanothermococcus sp.]MDK2986996.1 ribonuclease protein subunit [Methanothermococcus sp.]
MITPQNIIRHELIGLDVEIVKSTNPSLIGTKGRVIDETRNTLVVEKSNGKEIVIPKDIATFRFKLKNDELIKVDVNGKLLIGRPEDRLKRKIKQLYPY